MRVNQSAASYEISPPKGLVAINFPELWRFRDLFYIFVWRDIKVRYKQTAIGATWAIFQPLLTMLIFTVFFGRLARVPSDNIPYPVFVFAGLLFWNYFAAAFTNSSNSLVEHENIIKKVYFPRLILPVAVAITPMIDFGIAFLILLGLMVYYGFTPPLVTVLLVPTLILIAFCTAVGAGVLLGSLYTKFRDVRYVVPFFLQLGLFLTPVIYPVSLVPAQYQWLLFINPMTGVITLARSVLLGGSFPSPSLLALSLLSAGLISLFGIIYFRRTERFFADVL